MSIIWFGRMNPPAPFEVVPPPFSRLFLISMSLVALPTVPHFAVGAGLLAAVPHCTAMRTPPGKLLIVLLLSSARVRFDDVAATPPGTSWMPEPNELPPVAVVVPLVMVLFEILTSSSVPANWRIETPCHKAFVNVLPVTVTVPVTLASVAEPDGSLKAMLDS